jgi:nucleoside diphosphate kinase
MSQLKDCNWSDLTRLEQKRRLFSSDVYFLNAFDVLASGLDSSQARRLLNHCALMVIKPDCVAAGRSMLLIRTLDRLGFRTVGLRQVRLERDIMRNIWRYQWNIATLDRIFILSKLNAACETLLLLLSHDGFERDGIPASVRLASHKGSAVPARRKPTAIRSVLGCPNQFLSGIHVSDEPADVVRELGIFYGDEELPQIVDDWIGAREVAPDRLAKAVSEIETGCERHDLDPVQATSRLLDLIRRHDAADALSREDVWILQRVAAGEEAGKVHNFRRIIRGLADSGLTLPLWDVIVSGAAVAKPDIDGCRQEIDDSGYSGWLANRPRVENLDRSPPPC